jgi:predicted ATPase/class 3 adenylate cyclase
VHEPPAVTTFLFTDIEQSSRLWEQVPEKMGPALARHDALARSAVERNRGVLVKTTGDGIHAAFVDPRDAVNCILEFQRALASADAAGGVELRVRCGMHAGVVERRDNDFFGSAVNRAARIMGAAHGGQVLLSQAVADLLVNRLPPDVGLLDLGVVRLRDLASPERLYQILHPALPRSFPPLRSLESFPNNLPQQVTSFVGRDRELADVHGLLARGRLVTLHGAGGIGKTRLSLQAAADALADFPDGAWFVELAPLTDATRVAQAVASVLGVKEEAGRPIVEALVRAVRERRLLLVLDNCEHLIEACADLAAKLLQAGPQLKILATSREPLNVRGEALYPVPALGLPEPQREPAATLPTQYEAVRLFVERAATVDPAFELTPRNAPAVVEICRRLDGIPLAIELAAARVRGLSVENIAARLDDRFRLLVRGDRTALPRQQTLRALIDWSHDLLDERERALFRRLAVFAGGWTLEAAEAVCSGEGVDAGEVLDLQSQLVDKSLVVLDSERARYALLETVRQYAADRLVQSADGDGARSRHADFFLGLTEKVAPELFGPDQAAGLARLDAERENILSAHEWYRRTDGGAERDYRLVHAIKRYWFMRGLLNLGYRVTTDAVAPADGAATVARCRALWAAGQICSFMGRYDEAQRYLQQSLAMARVLGDREMMSAVRNNLALTALGQGDRAIARTHCEEALDLARKSGNKRQIASASNALAQVHRLNGDLESADPLYRDCVALSRELDDSAGVAVGLLNLAMVAISRGQAGSAHALLLEVLAIAAVTGSKPTVQSALEVSAGLAAARGEWERAAHFYGVAEIQTGMTGARRDPSDASFLEPLIAEARRALGEERFTEAKASGMAVPFDQAVADARTWLAAS